MSPVRIIDSSRWKFNSVGLIYQNSCGNSWPDKLNGLLMKFLTHVSKGNTPYRGTNPGISYIRRVVLKLIYAEIDSVVVVIVLSKFRWKYRRR